MMNGFGAHNWEVGLGRIIILIALVAIICLVVKVSYQNHNYNQRIGKSALDSLKKDAVGEINKDEFEEKERSYLIGSKS